MIELLSMRRFIVNKCFIDTNILVYFSYGKSDFHQRSKDKLKELTKSYQLFISNQVILEYINTITNEKVFKENAISIKEAVENIDLFLTFIELTSIQADYQRLRGNLLKTDIPRSKLFDMNIYATMIENQIDTILTVNMKDFELFKDIKVIDIEGKA